MAKTVVKEATILLHNLDVSGLTNNVGLTLAPEAVECSNYASEGWKEFLAGLKATEIPFEGYQDAAVLEPVLFDDMVDSGLEYPLLVATTRPIAAGDVAYFTNVFLTRFAERKQMGQVYGFSAQMERSAPLIRGLVSDNQNDATTGNGDALDLGVAIGSTERLYYAVFVTEANGTSPTLDLVLESDADAGFASATTRATLAQFTDTGSVFGYVAGPITDEFYRFVRTVGGSASPSFDFVAVIGRAPLT